MLLTAEAIDALYTARSSDAGVEFCTADATGLKNACFGYAAFRYTTDEVERIVWTRDDLDAKALSSLVESFPAHIAITALLGLPETVTSENLANAVRCVRAAVDSLVMWEFSNEHRYIDDSIEDKPHVTATRIKYLSDESFADLWSTLLINAAQVSELSPDDLSIATKFSSSPVRCSNETLLREMALVISNPESYARHKYLRPYSKISTAQNLLKATGGGTPETLGHIAEVVDGVTSYMGEKYSRTAQNTPYDWLIAPQSAATLTELLALPIARDMMQIIDGSARTLSRFPKKAQRAAVARTWANGMKRIHKDGPEACHMFADFVDAVSFDTLPEVHGKDGFTRFTWVDALFVYRKLSKRGSISLSDDVRELYKELANGYDGSPGELLAAVQGLVDSY